MSDRVGQKAGMHVPMEKFLYVLEGEGDAIIDSMTVSWGSALHVHGDQPAH